eukprot:195334-Pelagomonas_calceolata.AAC.4
MHAPVSEQWCGPTFVMCRCSKDAGQALLSSIYGAGGPIQSGGYEYVNPQSASIKAIWSKGGGSLSLLCSAAQYTSTGKSNDGIERCSGGSARMLCNYGAH